MNAMGEPGPDHDLEAHLEQLRVLDAVRRRSKELAQSGRRALRDWIGSKWFKTCELGDQAAALRVHLRIARGEATDALTEIANRITLEILHDPEAAQQSLREQLLQLRSSGVAELRGAAAIAAINERPDRSDVIITPSVLLACEAMRAFVSHSKFALSEQTMLCWYWIVRELYFAGEPEWIIGGARGGEAGWVTAYSTYHCVTAVSDLAKSLESTAAIFRKFSALSRAVSGLRAEHIPPAWAEMETRRACCAARTTLPELARKSAIPVDTDALFKTANGTDEAMSSEWELKEGWQQQLVDVAKAELVRTQDGLQRALESIKKFRAGEWPAMVKRSPTSAKLVEERPNVGEEARQKYERMTLTAHSVGAAAIEKACQHAEQALKKLAEPDDERDDLGLIARCFQDAAREARTTLDACHRYLSDVIDRELAISSRPNGAEGRTCEMTYACLAFAQLDEMHGADLARIQSAAERALEFIDASGSVACETQYHRTSGGVGLLVDTSTALGAIAELFRLGEHEMSVPVANRLLPYLEERWTERPSAENGLTGWFGEYDRTRRSTTLWDTSAAVYALDAIGAALDHGINRIILDHFESRMIQSGPDLDELFNPDYGFSCYPSKEGAEMPDRVFRQPLNSTLQRMRSHVLSGSPDTLCSLILHGPPGTGKTTMAEALARSCGVPLVEVTPSDLSKGGEVALEQRARAVFEALSYLTRVVILFDEFDPVLRNRDMSGTASVNMLSFLTPGMLPKLKLLRERAKRQSVAYVLITNLIDTLDGAAIRKGRFDEQVAVFPPDPLSRLGHLELLCATMAGKTGWDADRIDRNRMMQFVLRTGGKGLTPLMEAGWFRLDGSDLSRKPIGYIFQRCDTLKVQAEPEGEFNSSVQPKNPAAEREYVQWGWLTAWEHELGQTARESYQLDPTDSRLDSSTRNLVLGWPSSTASIDAQKDLESKLHSHRRSRQSTG